MPKVKKERSVPQKTPVHVAQPLNEADPISPNLLRETLENPNARPLLISNAQSIQRTYGNQFLLRLVHANSAPVTQHLSPHIQRLKIPQDIDPIAPDTDDTERFKAYIARLYERKDYRTLLAMQRFLREHQDESPSAKICFDHLNDLERHNTPPVRQGSQPSSPLQTTQITQLMQLDYPRALRALNEVKGNPDVLNRVFGPGNIPAGQKNIDLIKNQLTTCYKKGNIKPDESGELTATGSNAHNIGEGSDAQIILSREWVQASQADRIGTLIHEASHGTPGLTTLDIAYLKGWCIGSLTGASALKNADNYKKMALVHLHEAPDEKQLGGNAQYVDRVKRILAQSDFYLTTARVNALKILRGLELNQRASTIDDVSQMLLKAIKSPCMLPHNLRYSFTAPADIAKVTLFCGKFGQLVARLNAIATLATPDDGDVIYSVATSTLTLPIDTLNTMADTPIAMMVIHSLWGGLSEADWGIMDLVNVIWKLAHDNVGERAKVLKEVETSLSK